VVAFVLLVASPAARALEMQRSNAFAMRRSVDAVCDVYNARPHLIRHVQLARIHDGRSLGSWRLSSDAAVAKLVNAGTLDADFADVYSRDGKVVYATLTQGDASGDGGGAREYCYVNGKLARASTQVVDASVDRSMERKLYYDPSGNLFADTGVVVRDIEKRRNAVVPTASAPPLDIVPYSTPSLLPFYTAYRAALAGTLPALR